MRGCTNLRLIRTKHLNSYFRSSGLVKTEDLSFMKTIPKSLIIWTYLVMIITLVLLVISYG